jgi:cystathionine gamma-synthase/cystathionine gamma-lyase
MTESLAIDTLAVHAGLHPDPHHGAIMAPIVLSTTFVQPSPGAPISFDYSRSGNPTRAALEEALGALEGGRRAYAFGSGCAAASTLIHLFRPGDHIISGDDAYGGTHRIFNRIASPLGIETTYVDLSRPEALREAFRKNTRVVWLETPTNPLLKVFDIEAISQLAHAHGSIVVVDNTFASPALQRPLDFGADIVLHSTTKYLNGHSDVVGGALITNDVELSDRIKFLQNAIGAVPSPFDCFLVLRGLKTLPLRIRQHVRTATTLAQRLAEASAASLVRYPGLSTHPQYELVQRQMGGQGGGIISLEVVGGREGARRFLQALELFSLAESLGGVESLAEHPASMTHASVAPEVRQALGITEGLVRLSVGLEDVEDLWRDLQRGLLAAERSQ